MYKLLGYNFFLSELIFSLFFIVLSFMLILFGDTFLSIYVLFLFASLLIFSRFKSKYLFNLFDLFWIFFLFLSGISSFFTISIPLTLEFWLLHAFLLVGIFWAKTTFQTEKQNKKLFIISFILVIVAFLASIFSIVAMFIPTFANSIPNNNLIFPTYGHNHIGAFLILVIPPLSFFAISQKNIKQKFLFLSVFLLFSILILFSFGRVLIAIYFLELIFIYFKVRKKNPKSKMKKLFLFLIAVSFLIISTLVFLSYSGSKIEKLLCFSPEIKNRVCKSFKSELRPEYWNQAVVTLKDNFLFGSGPGTFELVSIKYRSTENASTAYAHNFILQVFAENGFMAGVFFLLAFGYLLVKNTTQLAKANYFDLKTCLSLSFVASFINGLMDYDLNLVSILFFTIIFGLLAVQGRNSLIKFETNFSMVLAKVGYVFITILVVLVFFVEILFIFKKPDLAFTFFPFHLAHSKLFFLNIGKDEQKVNKLLSIYNHHLKVYELIIISDTKDEKVNDYLHLLSLDPWYTEKGEDYVSTLISKKEYQEAESLFLEMSARVLKSEVNSGYSYDYSKKMALSKRGLIIANRLLNDYQLCEASRVIYGAYVLDEWIIDNLSIDINYNNFSSAEISCSITFLSKIESHKYGKNSLFFAEIYSQYLVDKSLYKKINQQELEYLFEIDSVVGMRLWNILYARFSSKHLKKEKNC